MTGRWIIDAMNVIGSRPDGWWNDPDRAMADFAVALDDYARASGEDVTVVFDKDPASLPQFERVDVVVARHRGRNAADHEIEQIVAEAVDRSALTVVTSDKRLVDSVRSLGATVVSSGAFRHRLDAQQR